MRISHAQHKMVQRNINSDVFGPFAIATRAALH